ncbi:hypothetical protein [Bradyrhizobium sp.]
MSSTNNQNRDQAAPLRLMEPDLAAWAEKITIDSTNDRRGLWYGAALFWIVVAGLIAARIAFLDPGRLQPSAASAAHSTLAGASSAAHETKL